jgi:SAM-dependent methyltransferase
MKARGYTNVLGITLSPEDIAVCKSKGHNVKAYDMSFLPQTDGFIEEAVDFVFCRQSLEHSPYPIFSLMEYNRILKQNGCIYIETPAPDCDRPHEYNKNHYSVLGANQLNALIQRTGFNIHNFNTTEYDLKFTDTAVEADSEKATQTFKEKAFCILASKARSIDIK